MAPKATCGLGCKAMCWPTASVLHVAGVHAPVAKFFPHSRVVEVQLSGKGFERLCTFVHDAVDRQGKPRAKSLGPGLYGESRFYPARKRYCCHRRCNTWTAQALRSAGCLITPCHALSAGSVYRQAANFGAR